MDISLCMVIKDEALNIEPCLSSIHDLFEDIHIIDTGSADGTIEILSDTFNIYPDVHPLRHRHCHSMSGIRNLCIKRAKSPWILYLMQMSG